MLDQIKEIQRRLEAAKAKADQARGRIDAAMEGLKETYGCNTIEEAEAKLAAYKSRAKKLDAIFTKKLKEFENDFAGILEDLD